MLSYYDCIFCFIYIIFCCKIYVDDQYINLISKVFTTLFVAMPVIERSPEHSAVEIGRVVQFSCFVSGVPAPEITYYHGDVEVVPNNRIFQTGSFLIITNAMTEDQGKYYCEATNIIGTAVSSPVTLVVFSKYQLMYLHIILQIFYNVQVLLN